MGQCKLGVQMTNKSIRVLANYCNNYCRKAMTRFYRIKAIHPYITGEACIILMHGLTVYHLDYVNCLMYGLPLKRIWKFQRI